MTELRLPSQGRHIIIAVDASSSSSYAVQWAIANSLNKRDTITLLHVCDFQPVLSVDLIAGLSVSMLNEDLEKRFANDSIQLR